MDQVSTRSRRNPPRMLALRDGRLFCRAAFNTKRKGKLTPRRDPPPFSSRLFFILPSSNRDTLSRFTNQRVATFETRWLALIHLTSPRRSHQPTPFGGFYDCRASKPVFNADKSSDGDSKYRVLRRLMIDIASRRLEIA